MRRPGELKQHRAQAACECRLVILFLLIYTARFHSEAASRWRNFSDPAFLPSPARQTQSSHPSGLVRLFIQRVFVRDKEESAQTWGGVMRVACPLAISALSPAFSLPSGQPLSRWAYLCVCREARAKEADTVIIVPMVNRWFPPPPVSTGRAYDWSGGLKALRFFMSHCWTQTFDIATFLMWIWKKHTT